MKDELFGMLVLIKYTIGFTHESILKIAEKSDDPNVIEILSQIGILNLQLGALEDAARKQRKDNKND